MAGLAKYNDLFVCGMGYVDRLSEIVRRPTPSTY